MATGTANAGPDLWERYIMAMDRVTDRLNRITSTLTEMGVPFALVGGQAFDFIEPKRAFFQRGGIEFLNGVAKTVPIYLAHANKQAFRQARKTRIQELLGPELRE
jgi:hypothetical protein